MKRRAATLIAALGIAAGASPGFAQDAKSGRAKAQACAVCHGPLGIAVMPDTPNIGGEPASYLARQLRAFRGGERRHEIMSVVAKPLSDADIADIAAWFASIRIEAQAP
jgi:cytochrome c553